MRVVRRPEWAEVLVAPSTEEHDPSSRGAEGARMRRNRSEWEDILRNAEAADSAASEAGAFVASAKRQSVAVGVGEELHHSVEEGLHSALL